MKYLKSLDYILAALQASQDGKHKTAASLLVKAGKETDFETAVAALERHQVKAHAEAASTKRMALSAFLAEVAAAKKKAKKKKPVVKKKVKADANDDDFQDILDGMTEGDETEVSDLEDIDLDMDDDTEGVDELPEANVAGDDVNDVDSDDDDDVELDFDDDQAEATADAADGDPTPGEEDDEDESGEDEDASLAAPVAVPVQAKAKAANHNKPSLAKTVPVAKPATTAAVVPAKKPSLAIASANLKALDQLVKRKPSK
jgi:hypothetical protein